MDDFKLAVQRRKELVAGRLSLLRFLSGYSREEVSLLIGIHIVTLSGYEVGRSEPSFEVLVRFADLYQVSLDYILCRTDMI